MSTGQPEPARGSLTHARSEPQVENAIYHAKAGMKVDNDASRDCSAWIRVLHLLGLGHAEIKEALDA